MRSDPAPVEQPFSRGRLIAALGIIAVVLALAAFAVGRFAAPVPRIPGTTSAEAGFARDLQAHDAQGVELATIVRDRGEDPRVRAAADAIALGLSREAGELAGWLAAWGLPTEGEPAMTWMTRPALDGSLHDMASMGDGTSLVPGDPLPGAATEDEVRRLSQARGAEADDLFLALMIAHERGAIDLAETVLERTDDPAVVALATSILDGRAAEAAELERLLAAR